MSSYIEAPATRKLAQNCVCCKRPLLDSNSVELGIGPICREKYGYSAEPEVAPNWDLVGNLLLCLVDLPETTPKVFESKDAHKLCNVLVHKAATTEYPEDLATLAKIIIAAGYVKLGKVVAKRMAKVQILVSMKTEGNTIVMKTPFVEGSLEDLRQVIGRRWDKLRKVNTFPVASRAQLWCFLKKHYANYLGQSDKGIFLICG